MKHKHGLSLKAVNIKATPMQVQLGAYKYVNDDWQTIAFIIPRSALKMNFSDPELMYNSVYFLVRKDGLSWKTYIGAVNQNENEDSIYKLQRKHNNSGSDSELLYKLRRTDAGKSAASHFIDEWDYVVVFTSKRNSWSASDVLILRSILKRSLREQNVFDMLHANNILDYDESEQYQSSIEQIKSYMALLGIDIFKCPANIEDFTIKTAAATKEVIEDLHNGFSRIPEIVTPQSVVDSMLDRLPDSVWNSKTTFLDPACKGGEYLKGIFNRLMETESLRAEFPNEIARAFHIIRNQLFGIALSNTSLVRSTNALNGYGDNIKVIPNYISILKSNPSKCLLVDKLKEEFGQMKFDIIIGNPPYQEATQSIYHHFINHAIALHPKHLMMVVKNNWVQSETLKPTRDKMIEAGLKTIIDYPIQGEVFPSIGVAVNVFHIDSEHKSKGYADISTIKNGQVVDKFNCNMKALPFIPLSQMDFNITCKVVSQMRESFSKEVYPTECFRITSNMGVGRGARRYDLDYRFDRTDEYSLGIVCMEYGAPIYKYIKREDCPARTEIIDDYKVISGEILSNNKSVITSIYGLEPCTACSSTFTPLYTSKSKEKAYGALTYIKTKFFRFLVKQLVHDGITHVSPYRFSLVPMQDFTKEWTDAELYSKYNLTQAEINYIESTINEAQA